MKLIKQSFFVTIVRREKDLINKKIEQVISYVIYLFIVDISYVIYLFIVDISFS